MAGWIKINRGITDDMQGYFGDRFNRPMCWIDLILLAEVKPKDTTIRGIKVVVERGQIAISTRDLSYRWSLSVPTVLKRLKGFVGDGLISISTSNVVNIITILNFEKYQVADEERKEPKPIQQDLFGFEQTSPQTEPKEAKRKPPSKPQKHRYAPEVLLTEDEYGKLVEAHGEDGANWMIQKLDNYKAARGTSYKSDYRAILNWVIGEYQKQQQYGKTSDIGQSATAMAKAQRDADFANYIAGKLSGTGLQGEVQDE